MKRIHGLLIAASLLTTLPALAHDEGHGPKVVDSGKFGGLLSAVVDKGEARLGPKAKLLHKAELVRSPEGKVQVYLYDETMKPIDASSWSKKALVSAMSLKKGSKPIKFEATYDGKAFVGQIPEGLTKPFNLDFVFTDKGHDLLSAFDNLD